MSTACRPAVDALLGRGLARLLSRTPVTPNQLSLTGFALSLAASALLLRGDYLFCLLGMLLFSGRGILDHADGELARLKDCCSEFGYRLDYTCDTLSLVFLLPAAGWGQVVELGPSAALLGIAGGAGIGGMYLLLYLLEARLGREVTRPRLRDRYETDDLLYLLPLFAVADAMFLFLWLAATVTPLLCIGLAVLLWRASRPGRRAA